MLTRYFSLGLLLAFVIALLFGHTVGGAVAALLFGFMAGNYACSLVHRLPRGKSLLADAPYCGSCAHPLSERDLMPVIGALLLKHRCRYCGASYPTSHTWTELLVGALFMLTFLEHGFGEQFLLISLIGVFLITLAAIEVNEGVIMGRILLSIAVFGMVNRALTDITIYGFFNGALLGLIVGAIVWRKHIKRAGHSYTLPAPVQLMAVGGLCVGDHGLPVFLLLFALFYWLDWAVRKTLKSSHPPFITGAFGVAAFLSVEYYLQLMLYTPSFNSFFY